MTRVPHSTAALLASICIASSSAHARLPEQAPPLPVPDPGTLSIVHVDTAQALAEACWNLTSDRAIVIAPGVYDLATVSFPNGIDGRLTVGRSGAAPTSNIQIRSAQRRRRRRTA